MVKQTVRHIPNIISLSRIPVLFIIVVLLYIPIRGAATIALVLFIIGAMTDWLDGYLARKYDIVSDFGKMIDALTDKIFVIGLFVALLARGFFPEGSVFLILFIIGREFIITGLRLIAASKGLVLAAEKRGKIKTLTQILTIGVFLLFNVLSKDFPQEVNPAILYWVEMTGIILLFIATAITIYSGLVYLIKYWDIFTEDSY